MLEDALDLIYENAVVPLDFGLLDDIFEAASEELDLGRRLVIDHGLVCSHLMLMDEVAAFERLLEAEAACDRDIPVHLRKKNL